LPPFRRLWDGACSAFPILIISICRFARWRASTCNDTAHQCIDLIARDGSVVQPYAHDIRSNGRADAVETRPRVQVREVDCVGCRLCFNVCPVEGCIAMVEEPSGRPPVTWGQITRSEPGVTEDWEKMEKYREKMGIHIH